MKHLFSIIIFVLFINMIKAQVITETPLLRAPAPQVHLQELVASAGDSYKNATYQLDWSIGELQTETYIQVADMLTQGFHQSNYIVTKIEQQMDMQYKIIAYPNPTTDFICLVFEKSSLHNIQYMVTDIQGNVLHSQKVTNATQYIDFADYANGMYVLVVTQGKQPNASFKIIKN